MKRVIRLHFKPILFLQNYNVYDNNNVSTGPMKTVTTYPMVVFFYRNTSASKPLHTMRYLSHQYYILQVHIISQLCQFPVVPGYFWRKVNFQKCKKFTRGGKNLFFGHNFFLLPSIISKFRKQGWFVILFVRHNSQLQPAVFQFLRKRNCNNLCKN